MKISHPPMPPVAHGPQSGDSTARGKSAPTSGTTPSTGEAGQTDVSASVRLSLGALEELQSGTPAAPGHSAESPAHQARAYIGQYPELADQSSGRVPFGHIVSQIARGVFVAPEPEPSGDELADGTASEVAVPGEVVPDESAGESPEGAPSDEAGETGDTTPAAQDDGAGGDGEPGGDLADALSDALAAQDLGTVEEAVIEELGADEEEGAA
jgi:hypothetical protein